MLTLQANGLSISCERRGRGLPLVLLHGYPLDHTIWEPLIPYLEKDFDLVLPDLRGFGGTDAPAGPYGMADMAADVAALLDAIHLPKAFVAGHSMGGYVALAFLQAWPQRMMGLGLVASQALADAPERKAGRYQQAERILAAGAQGVREVAEDMSARLTADPFLQARLKDLILRQRSQGLAAALRAMAERPDATALLAGFASPLALVHGLADALIPAERARQGKVVAPHAYLCEIPSVGHMPMMEAPQQTAEALRAAFGQLA